MSDDKKTDFANVAETIRQTPPPDPQIRRGQVVGKDGKVITLDEEPR